MKLICFDIDGTLTNENSWFTLNTALGMLPERDVELHALYTKGDITYQQWTEAIASSYLRTEVPHTEIIENTFSQPKLVSDALLVIQELQHKGYKIVLISGSFDVYAQKVSDILSVQDAYACSNIVFDDEGYVVGIDNLGDESKAKRALLEKVALQYEVPITDCICVGDGPNDVDMFVATGKGITFTDSPIKNEAWKVVDSLTEIVDILV